MTQKKISILVPNYKTLELSKLCLRLLRKYSDHDQVDVIVIDNDSQDASTDYLRGLKWIKYLERKNVPGDPGAKSHALALDLALSSVQTPYVLSIHTDTLIKKAGWLEFLLKKIESNPNIAGVGSWKLEFKPWFKRYAKHIENFIKHNWYRLINKTDHNLVGYGKNHYYLRSHCALYRMAYIRQYGLSFLGDNEVAGKTMHRKLLEKGHEMIFLPSETLGQYVEHINHATLVLNPQLGSRKKTIAQGQKRIHKILADLNAEAILNDDALDL
ncbi:MAG: glycosyltransferase [Pseudomonadota bacterium]